MKKKYRLEIAGRMRSKVSYFCGGDAARIARGRWITKLWRTIEPPKLIDSN